MNTCERDSSGKNCRRRRAVTKTHKHILAKGALDGEDVCEVEVAVKFRERRAEEADCGRDADRSFGTQGAKGPLLPSTRAALAPTIEIASSQLSAR